MRGFGEFVPCILGVDTLLVPARSAARDKAAGAQRQREGVGLLHRRLCGGGAEDGALLLTLWEPGECAPWGRCGLSQAGLQELDKRCGCLPAQRPRSLRSTLRRQWRTTTRCWRRRSRGARARRAASLSITAASSHAWGCCGNVLRPGSWRYVFCLRSLRTCFRLCNERAPLCAACLGGYTPLAGRRHASVTEGTRGLRRRPPRRPRTRRRQPSRRRRTWPTRFGPRPPCAGFSDVLSEPWPAAR
jgi:hypothetical protein